MTMTDNDTNHDEIDVLGQLTKYGDESGVETDPLADIESTVQAAEADLDNDLLDLFLAHRRQIGKITTDRTIDNYRYTFKKFREFMRSEGRHPACANETQVRGFITALLEGDGERGWVANKPSTVKHRITLIRGTYSWFCETDRLPHPIDANIVAKAHNNYPYHRYEPTPDGGLDGEGNRLPHIPIEELRRVISECTHIRDRAILVTMLKLGLRRSETANIELQDVSLLESPELHDHYPELGTHQGLIDQYTGDPFENAVIIPSGRPGNKSSRTRVLPLDPEVRRALVDYLIVRPSTPDESALFLSKSEYRQMVGENGDRGAGISNVWKERFWDVTTASRPNDMTSHAGRHYLTSFLETHTSLTSTQIDYIRGDSDSGGRGEPSRSANVYKNVFYRDIEADYRREIFSLGTA